jgi:hypothetical protein
MAEARKFEMGGGHRNQFWYINPLIPKTDVTSHLAIQRKGLTAGTSWLGNRSPTSESATTLQSCLKCALRIQHFGILSTVLSPIVERLPCNLFLALIFEHSYNGPKTSEDSLNVKHIVCGLWDASANHSFKQSCFHRATRLLNSLLWGCVTLKEKDPWIGLSVWPVGRLTGQSYQPLQHSMLIWWLQKMQE